jgi:hypothetical protein
VLAAVAGRPSRATVATGVALALTLRPDLLRDEDVMPTETQRPEDREATMRACGPEIVVVCSDVPALVAGLRQWHGPADDIRVIVGGSVRDLLARAGVARPDLLVVAAAEITADSAAALGRELRAALGVPAPRLLLATRGPVAVPAAAWWFDGVVPLDDPGPALARALDAAWLTRRRREQVVACRIPALLITGREPPLAATCTSFSGRTATLVGSRRLRAPDHPLTAFFYRPDGRAVDLEAEVVDAAAAGPPLDEPWRYSIRFRAPSFVELEVMYGLAAWRLEREGDDAVLWLEVALDAVAPLDDLAAHAAAATVIDLRGVAIASPAGLNRVRELLAAPRRPPLPRLRAVPLAVARVVCAAKADGAPWVVQSVVVTFTCRGCGPAPQPVTRTCTVGADLPRVICPICGAEMVPPADAAPLVAHFAETRARGAVPPLK